MGSSCRTAREALLLLDLEEATALFEEFAEGRGGLGEDALVVARVYAESGHYYGNKINIRGWGRREGKKMRGGGDFGEERMLWVGTKILE